MFVPFVLAAAMLPFAPPAASDKRPAWVILIKTQGDVPAGWREALTNAALADDTKTWVPPPAVTLEEAQVALGCSAWNDSCAGQVASMTGAVMALVVELSPRGPGMFVTVQKVRGGGAGSAPAEALELAGRESSDLEWASSFVSGLLRNERRGLLSVETDVPGANIFLDGRPLGTTPWRGPVAEGVHTLGLRQEGKAPLNKSIAVKGAMLNSEVLTMNAAGISVALSPTVGEGQPHAAEGNATLGWTLVGVGGALAIGAVAAGTPWAWALLGDRIPCGPETNGQKAACLRDPVNVYEVYGFQDFGKYDGPARAQFLVDSGAVLSAGVAAIGVGGLLIGTGVFMATGEPAAPAEIDEAKSTTGP